MKIPLHVRLIFGHYDSVISIQENQQIFNIPLIPSLVSLYSLSINFNVFLFCAGKNVSISLRNNATNSCDHFSSCLNPTGESKNSHCTPLFMTHDLIDLYIFRITLSTFLDTSYDINFFHNIALLIE